MMSVNIAAFFLPFRTKSNAMMPGMSYNGSKRDGKRGQDWELTIRTSV
jgi:hypothetical protein